MAKESVNWEDRARQAEGKLAWLRLELNAILCPDQPEEFEVDVVQLAKNVTSCIEHLREHQITGLSLATLRKATAQRQVHWFKGSPAALSYRGNELAGEVGEVCNVIKKLERERLGLAGSRDTVDHLAEELADVVICADLVALAEGINLSNAVVAKFNKTSEAVGIPVTLAQAY